MELVASLSEEVGYKAGLALTRKRIAEMIDNRKDGLVLGDDDDMVRIRSEVYDEHLCKILYRVGNIASPESTPSYFDLYLSFKNDVLLFPVYLSVQELFTRFCEESISLSVGPIDIDRFVLLAKAEYGSKGESIALAIGECLIADMHKSSFSNMRRKVWRDVADLEALFKNENIVTHHGEFFDQRYIDFLSHNFESIDIINWRKFEGLTCEFFHRNGFYVEIGKGRDDDSVDARIWQKGKKRNMPPLILVQCKRQKESVGKVVVKALYADVQYQKAKLGFIVTSNTLAPGAKKMCLARSYPIREINRETLEKWLKVMRTPYSGVFLGE